jgi:hypothetical protein
MPVNRHVISSINNDNTVIRNSKLLKDFREPLADAKRHPKKAELTLEWLTEQDRLI